MTIGYLHVGPPSHGVVRYGTVLSEAARTHLAHDVVTASTVLQGERQDDTARLQAAVRQLSTADVVHLQYNERVWGNAAAAQHIRTVCSACPAPIVTTVHDVRDGYGWRGIGQRTWAQRTTDAPTWTAPKADDRGRDANSDADRATGVWGSIQRAGQYVWKEWQNTRATTHLARHTAQVIVCTREEARRLRGIVPDDRLAVIPHFVEERSVDIATEDAKAMLDLSERRVCTVLGFIHRAKGHALVVEAMPHWPDDVHVVFAGRAAVGSEAFVHALEQRAAHLGVADRLRITGYLDEDTLNHYLAATDLALCPFEQVSASGSLSTWIAAERPIVASDQPQIAEYNAMAAGAIATFAPYTPEVLATAALHQLDGAADDGQAARAQLREKLSLPRIIQQHAAMYRAAAGSSSATNPHAE